MITILQPLCKVKCTHVYSLFHLILQFSSLHQSCQYNLTILCVNKIFFQLTCTCIKVKQKFYGKQQGVVGEGELSQSKVFKHGLQEFSNKVSNTVKCYRSRP